jgi:outer membrane protein with beta-barrel domain
MSLGSRKAMRFFHNFRFWEIQRTGTEFRASAFFALLAPALLLASAGTVRAQTVPGGNRGVLQLSAGATGSFDTIQYGSRQMYGAGAFVDAETTGHFGLEAEGRWIEFPQQNDNVHAETYSIGGRYHWVLTNHWQPYVKGLIGFGSFNYAYNLGHDHDLIVTAGGGVDFRCTHRIYFRVADFEYQDWPEAYYGNLTPFNVSAGLKVRIF